MRLATRTPAGMAIAQSKGMPRAKQPTLSTAQHNTLVRIKDSGEDTIVKLAELFKVSRTMVYRVFERSRVRDSDAGKISGTGTSVNSSSVPAGILIS